jgi:hypothetical protein
MFTVTGWATAPDWVRSLDGSNCLLQSTHLRCEPAVSNVAVKSMDEASPRGHQASFAAGSFLALHRRTASEQLGPAPW